MNIRPMWFDEYDLLDKLSAKNYPTFDKPDFKDGYYDKFVVHDTEGVILGGGIRKIAEVVLVTNVNRRTVTIGRGLVKALGHCVNSAREQNIDFLYAFCDNPDYENHLIQHGFTRIDARPLSLWVKNGR